MGSILLKAPQVQRAIADAIREGRRQAYLEGLEETRNLARKALTDDARVALLGLTYWFWQRIGTE